KAAAATIQEAIGTYRAKETGAIIPGFGDLDIEASTSQTSATSADIQSQREQALLERTANLGHTALELLRYFADNPGDRAAHAQFVLGYPLAEINRLLSGSLSPYMRRVG